MLAPWQIKPSDPEIRRRHEAEVDAMLQRTRNNDEKNKAARNEAIDAISKKYDCSREAAELLFKNKSY